MTAMHTGTGVDDPAAEFTFTGSDKAALPDAPPVETAVTPAGGTGTTGTSGGAAAVGD